MPKKKSSKKAVRRLSLRAAKEKAKQYRAIADMIGQDRVDYLIANTKYITAAEIAVIALWQEIEFQYGIEQ